MKKYWRLATDAIDFIPPPVTVFVAKADTVPFDIYSDYPGEDIVQGIQGSGTVDLFF